MGSDPCKIQISFKLHYKINKYMPRNPLANSNKRRNPPPPSGKFFLDPRMLTKKINVLCIFWLKLPKNILQICRLLHENKEIYCLLGGGGGFQFHIIFKTSDNFAPWSLIKTVLKVAPCLRIDPPHSLTTGIHFLAKYLVN